MLISLNILDFIYKNYIIIKCKILHVLYFYKYYIIVIIGLVHPKMKKT